MKTRDPYVAWVGASVVAGVVVYVVLWVVMHPPIGPSPGPSTDTGCFSRVLGPATYTWCDTGGETPQLFPPPSAP